MNWKVYKSHDYYAQDECTFCCCPLKSNQEDETPLDPETQVSSYGGNEPSVQQQPQSQQVLEQNSVSTYAMQSKLAINLLPTKNNYFENLFPFLGTKPYGSHLQHHKQTYFSFQRGGTG